jgi:Fe-S-cluster-containing dehydrogenase component
MEFSRRSFLSGIAAATVTAMVPGDRAEASVASDSYATLIDLAKCDGCKNRAEQKCVASCRAENAEKFPEPDPKMLKDYWPQKKHEDWSGKRDLKSRLTPYNWTFVQSVNVEHEGENVEVHVPRRCMHCDNPPCVKLCPFGVSKKDPKGPVHIDADLCFGGAKCRTVCPWDVPQRQAGVGLYTYLQPLPIGGGVMYKCDLCRDRLAVGELPSCVEACPNDAIQIGRREDIFAIADGLKDKYKGHIYGKDENGGTSTLYVSKVPFEKIDRAITESAKNPEKAMRMHKPANKLEEKSELAIAALVAPLAGIAGAFAATVSIKDKSESNKKAETKDIKEKNEQKEGSDE